MKPRLVYLDSSAIVKQYVEEAGSEKVCELYDSTLAGELTLSFSVWNIGEVLEVLDKYRRRGWLGHGDYAAERTMFIGETVRLLKLRLLLLVPVHVRLLASAWELSRSTTSTRASTERRQQRGSAASCCGERPATPAARRASGAWPAASRRLLQRASRLAAWLRSARNRLACSTRRS